MNKNLEMTQEQLEAKTKKHRKIIKKLHNNVIADLEVMDAELLLTSLQAIIRQNFMATDQAIKVSKCEQFAVPDSEELQEAYDLFKNLTVHESLTYIDKMQNAVNMHKYKYLDDAKVKDLGIELLD